MSAIKNLLDASQVHPEWKPLLENALAHMDQDYLQSLLDDPHWLPGPNKIFHAFQRDLKNCRFILFGESPYPRRESANGIAFYDAAVSAIWSESGLSKAVNRATSLRNIFKTALLAENLITPTDDAKVTQDMIAAVDKSTLISTLAELFDALHQRGFLLLNATPVLNHSANVNKESRYWTAFIKQLLKAIKSHCAHPPTLLLWGKIAEKITALPESNDYHIISSEHPYNVSFIRNQDMLKLFSELRLLHQINS